MNILIDIGVNLVAAALGFCLGWLVRWLQKGIRDLRARRFWKPFAKDGSTIVVGRFTEFDLFEGSGFLGVGDARGLAELQSHFQTLGRQNLAVSYAEHVTGDDLKGNLILLGGPDANSVTKEVIQRVNTALHFGNPERYEIFLVDSQEKRAYAPRVNAQSSEVVVDYGIVIRAPNPFQPRKCILLIAGSYGFGTWAGVRLAISKHFMTDPIVSSSECFECLFETDVLRETPQDIRVITLRKIDARS